MYRHPIVRFLGLTFGGHINPMVLFYASREVEMISITNQGAYKALMVEYFSGSIPVPLETMADFKIRNLLRMLYFDDAKIDETLKKSKEIFSGMQIHYDPYFEIYL